VEFSSGVFIWRMLFVALCPLPFLLVAEAAEAVILGLGEHEA
jgi:hypothetical protein